MYKKTLSQSLRPHAFVYGKVWRSPFMQNGKDQ